MNRQERIELIDDFLLGSFTRESGVRAQVMRAGLWDQMTALTQAGDDHRPFGYCTPIYFPYDELWTFFFSAEIMADATADLDDEEMLAWLAYVKLHISVHVRLGLASGSSSDEHAVEHVVITAMPEAKPLIDKVFNTLFMGAMDG